jgi:DNA-binding LacI/PurR family transcriptional regulator
MSSSKKPTIYDVADRSGVSISTISRVLNAPNKVNPATRARVMAAIDVLGFVPKAEARARARRNTSRIGVLTPFFTAPSFVQRLRGAASALSSANYELVIFPVESVEQLQGHISSIPVMQDIDGLIIMSLAIQQKDALRLRDKGMETVLIEYFHRDLNSIVIDDIAGGRLAAQHLIRKGHKRIAFLGDIGPREKFAIHPIRKRLQGFKETLDQAGIALPRRYIVQAGFAPDGCQRCAHDLLTSRLPPTAVFAAADVQAISVIKEARRLKMRVPEDLAVMGFDDIDLADSMDLTTIRQSLDESGRLAAQILLASLVDPNHTLQHIRLPLTLIERLTT